MASETKITNAAAKAMGDALVLLLDAGSEPGEIHVYVGTTNAAAETIPAGALLAKLIMSDPAFTPGSAASPYVVTADSITSDVDADSGGLAGAFWGGSVSVAGTIETGVIQGSCGTVADATEDLRFDDATIVAGGTVAITAWTINQPTE
jgi:hypothetical protein